MSNEPVYITTPVGRFVMGDAFNGSDKDHQGRPRLNQSGQPKTQWFMGIAIPKADPGWPEMWSQITAVGQRDFPNGEWQRPDFAWKVVDGDSKYPDRPECAGCYIVRFSSGFAPSVYNAQNQQIADPSQCKRGDYVRAYISVRGNGDRQKPGIYVNHQMVQVCGYGEAINSGPSPEQAFGAPPATLPTGASQTPVAPVGGMPAPVNPIPPAPVGQVNAGQTAGAMGAPAPNVAGHSTSVAPPTMTIAPQAPTASPSSPVAPYPEILNGPTG